jgi:hypothetical protein
MKSDTLLGLARPADDGRSHWSSEQRSLRRVLGEQVAVQAPMSTALMGHRVKGAALLRRILLGVEAFVDHDPGLVEEHRAENVGVEVGTRHTEQAVGVVEFDAELEVLLDDIFDGDRRRL